jgi:D-sedoheptulose 7-phosphate isomerase
MPMSEIDLTRSIFLDAAAAHDTFVSRGVEVVIAAADAIRGAIKSGGQVLAFGNGGSASDAQHLVAELVGRFETERRALAAVALTADTNVLTAIANDYGYDQVFTRQIDGLARRGDVAFGISTSGRSPNVVAALARGRALGMVTIALTGRDGGQMGAHADIHLNVPLASTARVQEVHRTIMHAMCALIDRQIDAHA